MNDEPKTSPVFSKVSLTETPTMSFTDALGQIMVGKKVTRVNEWGPSDYGFLKDGWLQIYIRGEFHTWSVSEADMIATDWIVKEVN